jgi:hypothetical protein
LKHDAAMRFIPALAAIVFVAGCDRNPDNAGLGGVYPGSGRDALCLTGDQGEAKLRISLIAYGQGDTNCSLDGSAAIDGDRFIVEPKGDAECRIVGRREAESFILPPQIPKACAYYCGPGASLANKHFTFRANAPVPKDFGGDPLC